MIKSFSHTLPKTMTSLSLVALLATPTYAHAWGWGWFNRDHGHHHNEDRHRDDGYRGDGYRDNGYRDNGYRHDDRGSINVSVPVVFFTPRVSSNIRQYYSRHHRNDNWGHDERRWRRGEVLPRGVVYHDVPRSLAREFGPVPDGERLVRVGADLLLISVATGVVVDALQDINGY